MHANASKYGCMCGHTCGHQRTSSGIPGTLFTLSFETENKQSKLGWLVSLQHQEYKHLTLGLDSFSFSFFFLIMVLGIELRYLTLARQVLY